jgi:hypothetical protein
MQTSERGTIEQRKQFFQSLPGILALVDETI